jgi:hypothetical protein
VTLGNAYVSPNLASPTRLVLPRALSPDALRERVPSPQGELVHRTNQDETADLLLRRSSNVAAEVATADTSGKRLIAGGSMHLQLTFVLRSRP